MSTAKDPWGTIEGYTIADHGVSKVQALAVKLDDEGEQQVRQIIREELASMLDELRAKL